MQRKARPADEMAHDLEAEKGGKLYKGNYKQISDELKRESLEANITQQIDLLKSAYERGKVDLENTEAVRQQAVEFMEACKTAAVFPTMLAFAASLGLSRQRLYAFLQTHPENHPTVELIDGLRTSWAAILAQQGLTRQTSDAVTIFLLKNSGQGLQDKVEIEAAASQGPLGHEVAADKIAMKYAELPSD